MAVHRKRPLLRDPISGKRPRRRLLLLSALIVVGGLGVLTSAEAQEGSLSGGAATFAAGKFDSTVRLMTGVLQGDNVPPADAAKALYFRGLAYQKLGQHTRAIADLGAAMWLGLSTSERTVALVNRSLAYQAAGLKTQAEAELASARKTGSSGEVEKLLASNGGTGSDAGSINSPFATEVRTESGRTSTVASASQDAPLPPAPAPRNSEAANPSSWTTTQGEAAATPPPSSGNRLSRWWGSVRGSSSEPEPALAPPPAPESAPRAAAAAVPSAWTTQTQPEAGAAPGTRVATASPTAPVSSGGGGNYLLQLSPTRSEAEASALWKTVIKQNQQLASLQPRVEKTDMGNLGTFYRLQIGPFPDKAESLKLCNALKRSGVDCFLVNP